MKIIPDHAAPLYLSEVRHTDGRMTAALSPNPAQVATLAGAPASFRDVSVVREALLKGIAISRTETLRHVDAVEVGVKLHSLLEELIAAGGSIDAVDFHRVTLAPGLVTARSSSVLTGRGPHPSLARPGD
ncbi:hypothetical protein [Arthrobacter wenxiniae]|uniref:Uncharacterized protein n=1 Tax=Arthrobacter wenxiniae TaxID=2713570 RepID=A0A7Y7IIJ4_9MICC|nr:hypothetical protein [Arthrobacter wenxiniae]NVM96110.1 hypothetical protein [Arthrobacter wenxiniae]